MPSWQNQLLVQADFASWSSTLSQPCWVGRSPWKQGTVSGRILGGRRRPWLRPSWPKPTPSHSHPLDSPHGQKSAYSQELSWAVDPVTRPRSLSSGRERHIRKLQRVMRLGWERVTQVGCWELRVLQLAILSIINSFKKKKRQTSMKKQGLESRAWTKCQLPVLSGI